MTRLASTMYQNMLIQRNDISFTIAQLLLDFHGNEAMYQSKKGHYTIDTSAKLKLQARLGTITWESPKRGGTLADATANASCAL